MKRTLLLAMIAALFGVSDVQAWTFLATAAQMVQIRKIVLDVLKTTYDDPSAFCSSDGKPVTDAHYRDMRQYSRYPWRALDVDELTVRISAPLDLVFRDPKGVARTIIAAINIELPDLEYEVWVQDGYPIAVQLTYREGKISIEDLHGGGQ